MIVRLSGHPVCFTDEVMEHQFLEGFKPVNIEQYDGTTDPTIWIKDFLLHIHMARRDDLRAIKYTTKKYTSMMIRVCHSRSRFLSWMYIHDDFMTESR